jgi:hypothetical protein
MLGGIFDIAWRWKIGLPGTEVDKIDAFGSQPLSFHEDRKRRGNFHSRYVVRFFEQVLAYAQPNPPESLQFLLCN